MCRVTARTRRERQAGRHGFRAAWGIDGFTVLAQGGGLAQILPNIGGLLLMGAILYAAALFLFSRRGVFQR